MDVRGAERRALLVSALGEVRREAGSVAVKTLHAEQRRATIQTRRAEDTKGSEPTSQGTEKGAPGSSCRTDTGGPRAGPNSSPSPILHRRRAVEDLKHGLKVTSQQKMVRANEPAQLSQGVANRTVLQPTPRQRVESSNSRHNTAAIAAVVPVALRVLVKHRRGISEGRIAACAATTGATAATTLRSKQHRRSLVETSATQGLELLRAYSRLLRRLLLRARSEPHASVAAAPTPPGRRR